MRKNVYKDFAIKLAKRAGKIIKTNFCLGMRKEWKASDTPLTDTDVIINKLIIKAVQERFPTHGILGEELSKQGESEYIWVCDPVDGTTPFSHGLPISTFSLALTQAGKSIMGVVYDPFMNRLVVAEKGSGAYLNGRKISVSSVSRLSRVVIDVEAWSSHLYNLSSFKQILIRKACFPLSLGSVIYAGMLVASGEFAAAIYAGKKPWDAAALKVIVEEAGGKFTNLFNEEQSYEKEIKGFIASNGRLHGQLTNLIKPFLIGG